MKKHEFSIYNLYCYGEKTISIDESKSYLGQFIIKIPDFFTATIVIKPSFIKIEESNQPGNRKTGSMDLEIAESCKIDPIQISEDICSLISLAVNGYVFSKGKNETSYERNLISKGGWRRIVKEQSGEEIRKFVEICWVKYNKFRDSRKLFSVIRMLTKINELYSYAYIDQRLILTATLLENLKYTFAESEGYPIYKGKFAYKTKPKISVPFRNLIMSMTEAVNIPIDFTVCIQTLVDDRNQIIHEGIFNCDRKEMTIKSEYMFSFIQIYLLSLLGFTGHYYIYNDDNAIKFMS